MEVVLVGVNHKTAPVEVRERLAVLEGHVAAALQAMLGNGAVRECSILSTCNRSEVYATAESAAHAAEHIVSVLCARHGMTRDELQPFLYHRFNDDAARHLFSVASGLDSMILGEGQILAQVRETLRRATEHGAATSVMNRLLERALRAGKRARTETSIAKGASSVSAAAVELAKQIHGDLKQRRVLVVGTGKMGMLTVKLLIGAGVAEVVVLSRTMARAEAAAAMFAGQIAARAASMETLADALAETDVVVSCTASPVAVLTKTAVAAVLRRRRYRPLFIVDIAVPRDVEPEVNDLEGVYLYNVDDLSGVVQDRIVERQGEVAQVRAIVEDEVQAFAQYRSSLQIVPAIKRLRETFEAARLASLEDMLRDVRPEERERVEAFSRRMVNRVLHGPLTRIKALGQEGDVHDGLQFLMELFAESQSKAKPSEEASP